MGDDFEAGPSDVFWMTPDSDGGTTLIRLLALALLIAAPASVSAQRPYPLPVGEVSFSAWFRNPQREAAAVLQSSRSRRSSAVLDSSLIEEVATALTAARTAVPDLAEAISVREAAAIQLGLSASAGRRLRHRGRVTSEGAPPRRWTFDVRKDGSLTGIALLDSISRANGASGAALYALDDLTSRDPGFELVIWFRYFVNVPQLIPAYARVRGVEAPYELDRQETYVTTTIEPRDLKAQEWRFRFYEGRGDCPAGCTASVNSLVAYDRGSRVARLIRRDTVGQP